MLALIHNPPFVAVLQEAELPHANSNYSQQHSNR
jgi:hypothetical protein